MSEEKKLSLANIEGSINRLTRRLDELQKTVDLLFEDRKILEEVLGSIAHLKEIVHTSQSHQDNLTKDVKAEIKDVQFAVEDKVEEVKQTIDKKKIIKISGKSILSKLLFWKEGG